MGFTYSSPEEQRQIFARHFRPDPGLDEDQTVTGRFATIVNRYPDVPAVVTGGNSISYRELDARSDRVAGQILDMAPAMSRPVILATSRGIAASSAIMGILKAGQFYVPIDPGLPRALLTDRARSIGAAFMVVDDTTAVELADLAPPGCTVLNVDAGLPAGPAGPVGANVGPDDPACAIHSSGSTGSPKAAIQTHRNLRQIVTLRRQPGEHCAQTASLHFAWSIFEIFDTLLMGATLFPYNVAGGSFSDLRNFLLTSGIHHCGFPPTVFRRFCDSLDPDLVFTDVRSVYLGGAGILASDVDLVRRHFPPDAVLATGLSSTEAGHVTFYYVDRTLSGVTDPVPLGYARDGLKVDIVDDQGNPLPAGEVGEIVLTGRYLATGYWRNEAATEARFTNLPSGERLYQSGDRGWITEDGCLFFSGRTDNLVKVNARLIALEEIEAALMRLGGIQSAAVTVDRQRGLERLVALIVPAADRGPAARTIRTRLAELLPAHMVPSVIRPVAALPLTRTNKIDRRAIDREVARSAGAGTDRQ